MGPDSEITRQDCIEELQSVADDLGHAPTFAEYQAADTAFSVTPILDRFGTWNKAKDAAGLAVNHKGSKHSREACLDALQQAAAELGHPPSSREFETLETSVSTSTIISHFDTWDQAKTAAGLVSNE